MNFIPSAFERLYYPPNPTTTNASSRLERWRTQDEVTNRTSSHTYPLPKKPPLAERVDLMRGPFSCVFQGTALAYAIPLFSIFSNRPQKFSAQ